MFFVFIAIILGVIKAYLPIAIFISFLVILFNKKHLLASIWSPVFIGLTIVGLIFFLAVFLNII